MHERGDLTGITLWQSDYLPAALLLSFAVHVALLVIQFGQPPQPRPASPSSLEIVLVNTRSDTPPTEPAFIAQAALAGGGEHDAGTAASPVPASTENTPNDILLSALRKRQSELEHQQQALLAQLVAQHTAPDNPQSNAANPADTQPGDDDIDQENALLSARIAVLRERVEQYNKRPRTQFLGPSTTASHYALYLDAWRERVENIGTEHYPAQARGRIYGSLQVTVFIRANGAVEHIEIDRPSEHAILNQAARRILQLAAPFDPFPPDIARETDILAITRTWHFVSDQLETQQP